MAEISDDVRDLLEQPAVAVLTVARVDAMPHQTVVWYRLVDAALHIVTQARSSKIRHIRRNRDVSAVVVHPDNDFAYAVLEGKATVIEDTARARSELMSIAARYVGDVADDWIATLNDDPRVIITVAIDRVRANIRRPPARR